MENHDVCPFCGGKPIKKNPYSDRVKKAGIGAGALEVSGSGNVEMDPNPEKEEYFLCNGCNQKYVWADIDINLILKHLKGEENIPKLIKYYYPDNVSLTDLLTKHRTGIVRRHSDKVSWLSNMIIKRQLYICFNYDGKRTFGTFIRKEKEKYYYTMKTMGVPKL
ncbi:hypothetical protein [Nitrosopumilus sp.]|uniref:hypothetical protein n=1 Tax=Nitrosopumilus sp. TaxID=2024843 RepID=UPI00247D2069|nr:hypothetical protein [Nitrosopumilus sp.]MCV0409360.1 hypothetical protein [Nitrosopumilus sp.]